MTDLRVRASLRRLKLSPDTAIQSEIKQIYVQSRDFFASSTIAFRNLESLAPNLAGIQKVMTEQTIENIRNTAQVIGSLDTISSDSKAMIYQSHSTARRLRSLQSQFSRSIRALISIATDIKEILSRLQSFSKYFSESIIANGSVELFSQSRKPKTIVQSQPLKVLVLIIPLKEEATGHPPNDEKTRPSCRSYSPAPHVTHHQARRRSWRKLGFAIPSLPDFPGIYRF